MTMMEGEGVTFDKIVIEGGGVLVSYRDHLFATQSVSR